MLSRVFGWSVGFEEGCNVCIFRILEEGLLIM